MIHEYFIQPELIYKWAESKKDAAYFLRSLGVGTTRLLSTFPKKKSGKLISYLIQNMPDGLSDIAKSRLDELVRGLANNTIKRAVVNDLPENWVQAVALECDRCKPDVILSLESIEGIEICITDDQAYEQDALFNHPTQLNPKRTVEAYIGATSNLLRLSGRIVVVEPYMAKGPGITVAKAFMEASRKNRVNNSEINFQFLFDSKHSRKDYVLGELKPIADELGIKLEVFALVEKEHGEKIHNRYLLTEFGGISFGVGTDANNEYHTDDLVLLEKEPYQKRWNQYFNAAAFDVEG